MSTTEAGIRWKRLQKYFAARVEVRKNGKTNRIFRI